MYICVIVDEATFADSMQQDAIDKKHSTISEAIGAGLDMNAHFILLTHFSQRYATLPNLPTHGRGGEDIRILPAFDFMTVRVRDMLWASRLTPVYVELLSLEGEEGEDGEGVQEEDINPGPCKGKGKIPEKTKTKLRVVKSNQSSVGRDMLKERGVICTCVFHQGVVQGSDTDNPALTSIPHTAGAVNMSEQLCGVCHSVRGQRHGTKSQELQLDFLDKGIHSDSLSETSNNSKEKFANRKRKII